MDTRLRIALPIGFAILATSAFFAGRQVEEQALAANALAHGQQTATSNAVTAPVAPSYRQLPLAEILVLPFAEFYEALRSAPGPAREKWAAELEKMSPGPRRTAALSAYYKLLVQFDPTAAVKIIAEIKDDSLQRLALGRAVDAAPGFSMREMAELVWSLREQGGRGLLWEVLGQWSPIDPAGAARFLDEHPNDDPNVGYWDVVTNWAALDPKAAKGWLEKNGQSEIPELRRAFIDGWYENDRPAAVSYLLAHADDPALKEARADVLRALYADSKDEAKKFIERLPDEKLRCEAFRGAFEYMIVETAEGAGEPNLTSRAAGDWMTQFPPAYWNGALSSVFEWWTEGSPQEVFAWIEQQPPALRELVAAEYKKPFKKPTAEAVAPILQIADSNFRDQLLTALFKHLDEGTNQVRDSIAASSLPPAEKDYVLQIFAKVEASRNAQCNE